jgi:hypothetical protein
MFYNHHVVPITLDSGAESSLILHSTLHRLGLKPKPTTQRACQADGKSGMNVVGEVDFILTRNRIPFLVNAMVVKDLGTEFLAGEPFFEDNKIILDTPRRQIIVADKKAIPYDNLHTELSTSVIESRSILRAEHNFILFPGDYIDLRANQRNDGHELLMEPKNLEDPLWPAPSIISSVGGNRRNIRLVNDTANAITIRKSQHVASLTPIETLSSSLQTPSDRYQPQKIGTISPNQPFATSVQVDPDAILSPAQRRLFHNLHEEYDVIFDPKIGKYNDASGRIRARINIGPVKPPRTKGFLPDYTRDRMDQLQQKMDELEDLGVLGKPDEHGVIVESVSPSFLVGKPDGSHRFVTNFTNLAPFARPPPSRATCTDEILMFLAKWKYIIKSDMTNQFYQLPLDKESMKFSGVLTPYKGIRIYLRAAMGMPGSSEYLDELVFRILGNLIHEGICNKIADDLYVGGDTPEELSDN